ncbi:CorA metal ion transporter [Dissophora globulifera]|nr:CorA metal ion transporter [Dissophora globulifera]
MILTQASLQGPPGTDGPRVFSDLLKDGCFWIDILDPSDIDMQIVARYFHVHPLTIEDISTEEVREKYEVFRNYYFVCFRTFDQDYNSGSYLQPASMYSVVLRDGIITFHSHITLTPDWINYALLDDITDSFASPIQTIEYEVDSIDELVLLLRENETSDMLRRIGSCRKNVMMISRLLTNKADVIRGLMKRFDERYIIATGGGWGNMSAGTPMAITTGTGVAASTTPEAGGLKDAARDSPASGAAGVTPASATSTAAAAATAAATTARGTSTPMARSSTLPGTNYLPQLTPQPAPLTLQPYRDGEILLYLGDILDHVLTMLQSLYGYEKVLGRSHSNYLAQISLEINQLSNKTNSVVGTLTFFASLIVPMTFVAGLWGMNVHVPGQPGQEGEPLHWWWGLCGFMGLYATVAVFFGKRYGLI